MIVSLQLAQQYVGNVDYMTLDHNELVNRLGAQLGAIESVTDLGSHYQEIYVAKVISCEPHPDSDHMHICMLDVGDVHSELWSENSTHIQVVCGAPNVAAGQTVAWLAPGSTVPASFADKEPFVLGSRSLRGVMSNGMIGSQKELALGDDHEGILVIDDEEVTTDLLKPGTPFVELYGLDDFLIDCENKMFTHRPDCFGNLGVAREIAGIFGQQFVSPDWYQNQPSFSQITGVLPFTTKLDTNSVPRFMAVVMNNVSIKASPIWLQSMLVRVGIRPISNVVDVTNFVMHLTGQPLHAFDYDKLVKLCGGKAVELGPRMAHEGEELSLLNGKTIKLTANDIVISCNGKAVALGGVMGGVDTEVDADTKNIVIECANFDMYTIRRTSMRHGLFTDAVTRFNKGQSYLQNDRVLAFTMTRMSEISGAVQASSVCDNKNYPDQTQSDEAMIHKPVTVTAEFINDRLGSDLMSDDIKKFLETVEMGVVVIGQELVIRAPFWRTDIEQPEDVVEEVGRLYGYDKLPVVLPKRMMKPTQRHAGQDFKTLIRKSLIRAGANEVLSYSFVHGDLLLKTGTDPDKTAYHIRNAISPDLQYYRTALIPSLLDKVHANIKAGLVQSEDNEFVLFEIGKAHVKDHIKFDVDAVDQRVEKVELPVEFERLAVVVAADEKTATRKYEGSALYMTKKYALSFLTGTVEFAPLSSNEYPITAPYEKLRSASISIDGQVLGVIGEFRASVKKALKLPEFCAGFEIDLSLLREKLAKQQYMPISTYPKTMQDITLAVPSAVTFSEVETIFRSQLAHSHDQHGYDWRIAPRDIYQKDGSDTAHMTFRIWLNHPSKTLTTVEVNVLLNTISDEMKNALGAQRI